MVEEGTIPSEEVLLPNGPSCEESNPSGLFTILANFCNHLSVELAMEEDQEISCTSLP